MNELYHHGIKGQKWGIRRFQDYSGRLTSAGKQHVKERKKQTNKTIDDYIKIGKIKVDNLSSYSVGSLSTMTISTGEKYVSGLLNGHDFDWQEVTNSTRYGIQPVSEIAKKNIEVLGNAGKYSFNENDSIFERSINHGRVDDYSMRKCNPEFGSPGTVQNCCKCSATLELACRGYNFMAGRQSYPSSVDAPEYWFKGAERMHMDSDVTEKSITSFGNKTSGILSIQYPDNSGGHAMHWTVDDEGSFEIQDGQNGRRFSSLSDMMSTYGADSSLGIDVFRLDNCEPDWDHLSSDSVLRDPDGSYKSYNRVRNRFSGKVVDTW